MSRVINPDGIGKQRTQLTRAVVLALRQLMQQTEPNLQTSDLAAFIGMALIAIADTIDTSVLAWEKRGYWIKADRFRLEWAWTESYGNAMQKAVLQEDWQTVAITAAHIAEKLNNVQVPKRHQLGTPWVGAWKKLNNSEHSR